MKPNVHVMLVSAQAAPNLLPALDSAMKPDEAVLLTSAKMQGRADALQSVLSQTGVKVSRIALPDEHDYAAMQLLLLDLASTRDGQAIAINVTGGTKLMALAAQSIAQTAGWPVFYVDVDTDEVVWVGDNAKPRHKLAEQLRLNHYLAAYGFSRQTGRPLAGDHADLIKTLLLQIGSLEQPLAQLNWLAQQAEDKGILTVHLDARQRDSRGLEALLRHFQDSGVLHVESENVHFSNREALGFAKGGWLEHHVFRRVAALGDELGIRDKACNLEVVDANNAKNELDIAFMARNRLFVIECKTARMDKPEAPKANDTLFKLAEVCRRVGGLGTRAMLASYRALRPAEQNLARALNIDLICGVDLANLDSKLKAWVGK